MKRGICAPWSHSVSVPPQTLTGEAVRNVAAMVRTAISANVAWLH